MINRALQPKILETKEELLKLYDLPLGELLKEAKIETKKLPSGIEFHKRYGEDSVYEFYLNVSQKAIELENLCGVNMLSGDRIEGSVMLEPKGYVVVKAE